MVSHQFTIERAKFSAGLLKPDVTTISREQVSSSIELLDKAILQCSPTNIESCKTWLLHDIVPSSARVGVLGKYLVALGKAQAGLEKYAEDDGVVPSRVFRRRLHVLYLLNDVLHHAKHHCSDSAQFSTFSGFIQPSLVELIRLASSGNGQRIHARIKILLHVWEEEGYYSKGYVDKLREAALQSVTETGQDDSVDARAWNGKALETREQPYMMPASHGDSSTPFYDLAAGNMMRHIMPNQPDPIHPDDVRPLQFVAGPADESLVTAIQDFMAAVSGIDQGAIHARQDEDGVETVDELGQVSFRDETGELVPGRTYYGWSREFCLRMRNRGQRKGGRPVRDRSSSFSRSGSRSPRKRRRYSGSISGRSVSSSRSRSRSRDTSHHPNFRSNGRRYSPHQDTHHRSRSDSRSRSHSRSPSRSYSPSYQPALPPPATGSTPNFPLQSYNSPQRPYPTAQNAAASSMSTTNIGFHQFPFSPLPLGPGGVPMPPPPPPNYTGPWPPPPPPPLPLGTSMAFSSSLSAGQAHSGQPPSFTRSPPPPGQRRQWEYGRPDQGRW